MKTSTFLKKGWRQSNGYTDAGNFTSKVQSINSDWDGAVYPYHKGGFTANGHVVHIDYSYDGEFTDVNVPRLDNINKGNLLARIAVTKDHFIRALKACKAIRTSTIVINANHWLETVGVGETGNSQCGMRNFDTWRLGKKDKTLLYRKVGKDVTIRLDPMYIINAVLGMGDIFIISVYSNNLVILQDESREAWIKERNE